MKLFRTSDISVVIYCQGMFQFDLPSVTLKKRLKKFDTTLLNRTVKIFTAQCTLVHLRGLGIACRLSVCPSVRLSVTLVDCDHIGWKSWKLIARATSPTPSLFVAKRRST